MRKVYYRTGLRGWIKYLPTPLIKMYVLCLIVVVPLCPIFSKATLKETITDWWELLTAEIKKGSK